MIPRGGCRQEQALSSQGLGRLIAAYEYYISNYHTRSQTWSTYRFVGGEPFLDVAR